MFFCKINIVLILILIMTPVLLFSRPIDVNLTGKELLIEFQLSGPSTAPPGIYAYDDDKKELKVVMPFAINPKWSPDHKKIAMYCEKDFLIFDTVNKSIKKIEKNQAVSIMCRPESTDYFWINNEEVCWLTNSAVPKLRIDENLENNNLNFKLSPYSIQYYLWQYNKTLYYSSNIGNKIDVVLNDNKHNSTGNISFDVKNGVFADCMQYKKNETLISSIIVAGRIGEEKFDIIPKDKDEIIINPKVQPGGRIVAYESISKEKGIVDIKLYDVFEKKIIPFTGKDNIKFSDDDIGFYDSNFDLFLYNWTNDGSGIVFGLKKYKKEETFSKEMSICLFDFNTKKNYYIPLVTYGEKSIFNKISNWSPDNKKLALIVKENSELIMDKLYHIEIFNNETRKYTFIDQLLNNESKFKNLLPVAVSW